MAFPRWLRGYDKDVDSTPIDSGQILVTIDSGKLFVDIDNIRIPISDLIFLTYNELASATRYKNKFYYTTDTHKIYYYDNGWKILAGDRPSINNNKTDHTNTTIYAPTTGGAAGNMLVANGTTSAPSWVTPQSMLARLGCGYGICSTSAADTNKIVNLADYAIVTGGHVSVQFENSVPASSNLNINNRGAKAIFHIGYPIKENIIQEGDIAMFVFDGTNYQLLSVSSSAGSDYGLIQ